MQAAERIRTADPFITSEVLYQLSYGGAGLSLEAAPPDPRLSRACTLTCALTASARGAVGARDACSLQVIVSLPDFALRARLDRHLDLEPDASPIRDRVELQAAGTCRTSTAVVTLSPPWVYLTL